MIHLKSITVLFKDWNVCKVRPFFLGRVFWFLLFLDVLTICKVIYSRKTSVLRILSRLMATVIKYLEQVHW